MALDSPTRDRRLERYESTRREILDAAWDLARENGLGALSLRDIAVRVGMRAPSLYSYFESKSALYDAMFADAWTECREAMRAADQRRPRSPRAVLRYAARSYLDFAVADPVRYQLMNQRSVPGFRPSPASYRSSQDTYELMVGMLRDVGVRDRTGPDLWTAILAGCADQQMANDPGGTRWRRVLDRAVEMYADAMGVGGRTSRGGT